VPYFDASEDGTPVRQLLTEVRPGLFLAENGETLDLRGPLLSGNDFAPALQHWSMGCMRVVAVVAAA
jgi:hypothetical protein